MSILKIEHLSKSYHGTPVLNDITMSIEDGEVLTLIGESGGGKSTLLRCINLLESYEEGTITYKGQNIKDSHFSLPHYRREVGMIFQKFNLFQNINVLENLNLGQIKVLKKSKEEASKTSIEMLKKVGLEPYQNYRVQNLSGGQSQRVAIARSLCMNPSMLLLDEPTSALDPVMVKEVLHVIREIAHTGITFIMVTHEMQTTKEISDKLIFLKNGCIWEEGPAKKLFESPETAELKAYLGHRF